MPKHLINFSDLTKKDILDLIELANNFKSEDSLDYRNENLFPDKKIVSMFCESSTRTKLSFEIAAHNLGAKFIDFDLSNSSMNKGETLEDTMNAFEMMGVDLCILRHTESVIHEFVKNFSNMQFINAGEGSVSHPTQTLIDLMTIQESKENYFGLVAKGFAINILNVGVFIFWGGVFIVSSPAIGKSFTDFSLFFAIVLLSYFATDLIKISVANRFKNLLTSSTYKV